MTDYADLMTVNEAAVALRLCRRSVYNQMSTGALRAVKLGRRTLIPRTEISRFVGELPHFPSARAA